MDFEDLFATLRQERGVDRESVIAAIEAALLAGYRAGSDARSTAYARAVFDPATGRMAIERLRDLHAGDLPRPGIDVVDGPKGREIAVVDWQTLPDEERETIELSGERFGRIAATAAKDALRSDMRGSEQQAVHARYRELVGTIVEGVAGEQVADGVLVALGDAEAIIPSAHRLPGPAPRPGDGIAAVVVAVAEQSAGAQVTLSQTDERMVRAAFASEVAEVRDGRIELVRVARVPGVRSKAAVATRSEDRLGESAVAICIGERGSRIRLIRDLLGEEIDLLAYDADPLRLVAAALAPAKVRRVETAGAGFLAVVSEEDRALAAGADGQGVRLASMLVGGPIELHVETAAEARDARDAAAEGTCAYVRPNGRRCANAALPGSRFCGLPAHQAAESS
jgi:N utilization substance protein A